MATTAHLVIGADDAGHGLKAIIEAYLDEQGVTYDDVGVDSPDATALGIDYPDVAERAAVEIRDGRYERGILICGTGIGMAIAANKVPGIRAASVTDQESARLSREHNDANVLALGASVVNPGLARRMLEVWLKTPFAGGRHARRVDKIMELDRLRTPVPEGKA
jgi:ribose 5-phosphate isomerase B